MDRPPRSTAAAPPDTPVRLAFDRFLLDEADARLSQAGQVVALPPKAFAVLCALARHAGRLVGKDTLLDAVWGHRHVSESVLKSTISQVRAALGDDVRQPRYIETASRHGYRFIAPVSAPADGMPDVAGAAPRPAPAQRAPVGRASALRRLDEAWAEACTGHRRITWVSGEAGIGKSTVIDAWLRHARPARVARGQCLESFGAGEPYLPILESLSLLCRAEPAQVDALRRFAPTWLLQLPWLHAAGEATELRASLTGTSQDRMLREACELLEHASRDQPLVLVIEDLHWSDASTVSLLEALARRREPARLLVLGSFRPAELVASEHPLKHLRHELRAHRLCEELSLDPLSERDVADLLRQRLGGAHDEALAAAVHARTDGLPLFLDKVIEDLAARRGGSTGDSRDHLEALALRVPESLGGIILRQWSRLAPGAQAVLRAASVRGQAFSRDCVAAVLGEADSGIDACLADLVAAGAWIEESGVERHPDGRLHAGYRFRHALFAQVLQGTFTESGRAEAHLRLARELAGRATQGEGLAAAEIALHFERGHAPAEALRWLTEAASTALARYAPGEAIGHADRGLDLVRRRPPDDATRASELSLRVTRGVATAQRHGVGSREALLHLEQARLISEATPHGPQHTWLMNGLGWIHFSRGDLVQASARGLAMARRGDAERDPVLSLCAANLMGAVRAYGGQLEEALSWLDRALALLPAGGDDAATARSIVDLATSVRVYRAQALDYLGHAESAAAEAHAALERARGLGQPMSVSLALRLKCLLAIRHDDAAAAEEGSRELMALAGRHGIAQSLGPARWFRGWARARAGDAAEGLALVLEGLAGHAALGMATGTALARCFAARIHLAQGDAAGARRELETAIADAEARGECLDLPEAYRLLSDVEAVGGQARAAATAAQRAATLARTMGLAWPG